MFVKVNKNTAITLKYLQLQISSFNLEIIFHVELLAIKHFNPLFCKN